MLIIQLLTKQHTVQVCITILLGGSNKVRKGSGVKQINLLFYVF